MIKPSININIMHKQNACNSNELKCSLMFTCLAGLVCFSNTDHNATENVNFINGRVALRNVFTRFRS